MPEIPGYRQQSNASDWLPISEGPEIMIEFEWQEKEHTEDNPLEIQCPVCQAKLYLKSQVQVRFVPVRYELAPEPVETPKENL